MNKQIKYDQFERTVQVKVDGYSNDYGKSWKTIDKKLNNSSKSNKKRNIIIISIITAFAILFNKYYEQPQNDSVIGITEKNEINKNYIPEIKNVKTKKEIIISKKIPKKTVNKRERIHNKNNSKRTSNNILSKNEDDSIKNYVKKGKSIDTNNSIKINHKKIINQSLLEKKISIICSKHTGCIGDSFHFSSTIKDFDKLNIQWYLNDTLVSSLNEYHYIPYSNGKFKISIQLNKKDLSTYRISDSISVFKNPTIDFDYEITEDNGIVSTYFSPYITKSINDISEINKKFKKGDFHWDFGDGKFSNMPYSRNQFLKNGNYKVLLGYTSVEGCYQNIEKSIEITSNFDILAPNSFTPNGDGRNDEFMPEGLKTKGQPFEMKIFDRTGEIIFITKNANNGWNGFNQTTGSKSGSDNYLWVVEIKEENGKVSLFKGSLLLIDN